jgi:hypothetical protein
MGHRRRRNQVPRPKRPSSKATTRLRTGCLIRLRSFLKGSLLLGIGFLMASAVLATWVIRSENRHYEKAVLRKWQGCCKLGVILRTERNSIHGYLPTVQMASLPIRDYFALCPLVFAVSAQLPRSGGDDDRTRIAYRSHDDLPLSAALRIRTGETLSIPSESHG